MSKFKQFWQQLFHNKEEQVQQEDVISAPRRDTSISKAQYRKQQLAEIDAKDQFGIVPINEVIYFIRARYFEDGYTAFAVARCSEKDVKSGHWSMKKGLNLTRVRAKNNQFVMYLPGQITDSNMSAASVMIAEYIESVGCRVIEHTKIAEVTNA